MIARLKPVIEPHLAELNASWSDAAEAMEATGSIDELREALKNPTEYIIAELPHLLEMATITPLSPPPSPPEVRFSIKSMKSFSVREKAKSVGFTPDAVISAQVKLRILISFVQVLGQLGVAFSIPFPPFYKKLVGVLNAFTLDIFEMMPLGCIFAIDHDVLLLARTLLPLGILGLSLMYRKQKKAAAVRLRGAGSHSEANINQALANQIMTYNFIIFYLLFPSNSANIFATFGCETLDDPERTSFLRKDFSVNCNTPFHRLMEIYAGIMIFVYPIGIPAMYTYLLFYKHRDEMRELQDLELEHAALQKCVDIQANRPAADKARTESMREQIQHLKEKEEQKRAMLPDYVQKLVLGYELRTFWFEIIESVRKLAIVCLPVFFQPSGSVSQLIFGLLVCFFTFSAFASVAPYTGDSDDNLASICQVQIFVSLLSAAALKYDATTLRNASNVDALLCGLTILPIVIAAFVETPLGKHVKTREARDALFQRVTKVPRELISSYSRMRPRVQPRSSSIIRGIKAAGEAGGADEPSSIVIPISADQEEMARHCRIALPESEIMVHDS